MGRQPAGAVPGPGAGSCPAGGLRAHQNCRPTPRPAPGNRALPAGAGLGSAPLVDNLLGAMVKAAKSIYEEKVYFSFRDFALTSANGSRVKLPVNGV
jgi:hypothetical protein